MQPHHQYSLQFKCHLVMFVRTHPSNLSAIWPRCWCCVSPAGITDGRSYRQCRRRAEGKVKHGEKKQDGGKKTKNSVSPQRTKKERFNVAGLNLARCHWCLHLTSWLFQFLASTHTTKRWWAGEHTAWGPSGSYGPNNSRWHTVRPLQSGCCVHVTQQETVKGRKARSLNWILNECSCRLK